MVDYLDYIVDKYKINLNVKSPIEIRNVGRNNFAELLHELDVKVGVEVGVELGLYSEVLCKANPQAKIYGIDPYVTYSAYRDYTKQKDLDYFKQTSYDRLKDYNYEFIYKYSVDALEDFEDESLDFVYIDGNHELPFVLYDIINWTKKIKFGGIISGHDYYVSNRFSKKNHTLFAVNCYTDAYQVRPWFLLGTKAKLEGEIRDRERSWFWLRYEHLR